VTSVWGTEATEQRWWNSRFTTDGYTYPLGIGVIVTHDSPTVTSIQVDRMDVGIGYETSTISVRAARPTNCFPVASEIVDELVIGSYSRTVRIQITGSYVGRVEATPGPEGSNRCTTATLELARGSINVEFSATLEQLEAGYTYTAYDPDTGYTVQVRLAKKG
ncbi:MAG: hypothetical protein Q8M65_04970, partial [Rhodoglobus sp.]|nr:hypothetical protein [Rhodoglobus sp.]